VTAAPRPALLLAADALLASRQRVPEPSTDESCIKCGSYPDEACWNAEVDGGLCVRRPK